MTGNRKVLLRTLFKQAVALLRYSAWLHIELFANRCHYRHPRIWQWVHNTKYPPLEVKSGFCQVNWLHAITGDTGWMHFSMPAVLNCLLWSWQGELGFVGLMALLKQWERCCWVSCYLLQLWVQHACMPLTYFFFSDKYTVIEDLERKYWYRIYPKVKEFEQRCSAQFELRPVAVALVDIR